MRPLAYRILFVHVTPLTFYGTDGGIEIIGMQISLQERAVGGQVDHQLVNFAEGQHPVVELVIQQVTAAFAVIGNKMLVIPGDVDPLHMLRGRKPTSTPSRWLKRNTG